MKLGEKFIYMGDEARIMAIAEGYVMARKKGCYPFLVTVKEVEGSLAQRAVNTNKACANFKKAIDGKCYNCGFDEESHRLEKKGK